MSGRTVRDHCQDWAREHETTIPYSLLTVLGLDPDTPFDRTTQQCVVVDVCDRCAGRGEMWEDDPLGTGLTDCTECEGRGVTWTT